MAPADKQQSTDTQPTPATQVDRAQLEAARWRAGLASTAAAADDEPWTACRAPTNILVIDTNGSLRACDYGTTESTPAHAPLSNWSNETFAALRNDLAEGLLPTPHCETCAHWCHDDLYASAPPIRDYGSLTTTAASDSPRHLVVRLPSDGTLPRPKLLEEILSLDSRLETLTLQGHAVFANAATDQILDTLRSTTSQTRLRIRTTALDNAEAATQILTGLELEQLELRLQSADAATLATAATITERSAASLQIRFVFEPQTWFAFADVVLLGASHGATVNLHVLDEDGVVPLQSLDPAELSFLRTAVVDFWEPFNGANRPASLSDDAFSNLCSELLQLERHHSEPVPQTAKSTEQPIAALQLPPVDHDWCQGQDSARWHQRCFQHANTTALRTWLLAIDEDTVRERDWLRALCQRIAIGQQQSELLERLRRIYSRKDAKKVAQADQDFAEAFDLTPFGGPWADRLGLLQQPAQRAHAFSIGPANKPTGECPPDITVLIPSYRHEQFIEETIRSVLAQSHANFALLVADDRSPDDTVARAAEIEDQRIQVQTNEQNLGLGNSVLQALESVTTPFVALLNSDDLLHPDHLKTCRDALISNPDVQLVVTDIQPIDSNDGLLTGSTVSLVLDGKQVFDWVHWFDRIRPDRDVAPEQIFGELLERNYLVTSSNLVVRTDWLRAQAESLRSLKYCLDWRLFLQAALEGTLLHIRQPLVAYRLHASNTVWFEHERRDGYYLEVNRVATEAVQRWAERNPAADDSQIASVLEAVASHLSENHEADGFALFLNSVLNPLALDRSVANSPTCKALLGKLRAAADLRRLGPERTTEDHDLMATARQDALIQRQVADAERGQRRWLQVFTSNQAARIEEQQQLVNNIWAEKLALEQRIKSTRENLEARIQEMVQRSAQQEQTRVSLRKELEEESRKHRTAHENLKQTHAKLDARNVELREARNHQEQLGRQLRDLEAEFQAKREQLASEVARLQSQLAATSGQLEVTTGQLEVTTEQLEATSEQLEATNKQLRDQQSRITSLTNERQQLQATLSGREFRIGNFIWNKLPLGWLAGRIKKWYRRLLDFKTRMSMRILRRRSASKAGLGTAIVTATRDWPIYSHTFAYQEMLGLADMGFSARLFYWDKGDLSKLHHAFDRLREQSTQLQHHWGNHKNDLKHFEKTQPQRLRAFLERISALSGKSSEQLANEGIVLQGCTFARMVELSGARYLHSYFFYDQSFMAMMAAWLLELPRGISCYADHMLDDYPWKFVALQIELADVVVATSARIKQELSQLSGGQYDNKILVKPNGVDGTRFPAVTRQPHIAGQPFEVLSVSRIEPKKGLTYLVEAVAELQQRGYPVIVHVIGSEDPQSDGSIEYADLFRRRIEQLGMQKQIVLHGMLRQEQMAPISAKCHAFVAPYIETENGDKDGIPTAMLEAMASNLPVITTDSGSIQEVVTNDVEGLIVPQRQSTALADAMQRVLSDAALGQRLAQAARARFEKQFDIRVTEQLLHDRIATVINKKS